MGFLLMLGRRMRLRPKAETGLLLLLHEWTVNTQNTSILLTQAQRQRGSRRPASWIPRVELESTWPELLSVSESVPLRCWDGVRESGERSRKHFSSASSHQQDQSSNLEAGVTCTPPPPTVFAGSLTFCRTPLCSARTMPVTLVPNTSRHLCERNIHGDGDKHFFFYFANYVF